MKTAYIAFAAAVAFVMSVPAEASSRSFGSHGGGFGKQIGHGNSYGKQAGPGKQVGYGKQVGHGNSYGGHVNRPGNSHGGHVNKGPTHGKQTSGPAIGAAAGAQAGAKLNVLNLVKLNAGVGLGLGIGLLGGR